MAVGSAAARRPSWWIGVSVWHPGPAMSASTPTAPATTIPPLRIGPHEVWPPVVLAPMAGVTNAPFRALCRAQGAGLYVSEMVTARALVEGHERTLSIARFAPDEAPRSIQLYGTDPRTIAEAIRRLLGADGAQHVDLNFGCPVKKVTRHGGGAALPVKRKLLREVVRAAVRAAGDVPVTVKFRKGLDDQHLTFLDTGRIAEDEGCAAVAMHARTAEQLYSGRADWAAIAQLKAAVTSIPVLGNGDIWVAADALEMVRQTGCDGVVVGRGCLGRPWLFHDLADAFAGRPAASQPVLGEVAATMRDHAQRLVDWYGHHVGIRDFRKHTGWYLHGYPVGPEVRRALNQVASLDDLDRRLAALDPATDLPTESIGLPRGHQQGPRPVVVPHRFLEDPDDPTPLSREAEAVVSGG
ncbi:MAG: dihydrouridine synthase [Acidimicrobiales bacterium]|nr:dihydrouridine synthase [Acidimicrobiales bacterium]